MSNEKKESDAQIDAKLKLKKALERLDAAEQELEEAKRAMEQAWTSKGRIDALRHWEKMFLNGTAHDQHGEFIAGVLADKINQLKEDE